MPISSPRSCGWLFLIVLSLLGFSMTVGPSPILYACNPEPGPQHFFKVVAPTAPPIIKVGKFEVFNSLNGLPANEIRCLLLDGDRVLVGTDGKGLMILSNKESQAMNPGSSQPFPAKTVTTLNRSSEGTILAVTPEGLVEIRCRDKKRHPE